MGQAERVGNDETVALYLGEYLLREYEALLAKRFKGLPEKSDNHGLLAWIAKSRSLVIKGGAPDLQKAATILLTEFRSGALGRITLETAPVL